MDEYFIQLLIWIIGYEITKDERTEGFDHVFREICAFVSQKYNVQFKCDGQLSDSRINLAIKMINNYYNNFMEVFDDNYGDETVKLIEFPLENGKCVRDFRDMKIIGNGSFGKVYRSVSVLDNNEYAIKKVSLYGINNK